MAPKLASLFELSPLSKSARRTSQLSATSTESSSSSASSSSTSSEQQHRRPSAIEPWLSPLREEGWKDDLSIFLPGSQDTWKGEHTAITNELWQWNLSMDPYAGVQTSGVSKRALAFVEKNIPKELRHTALSFAGKVQVLQDPVTLNRNFLDALLRADRHTARRIARGKHVSLPLMPEAHFLCMAQQLPAEFYSIYATEISEEDLDHVITAVFILLCRQRFLTTARAVIQARTNDKVYKLFAGVFKLRRGPDNAILSGAIDKVPQSLHTSTNSPTVLVAVSHTS